MRTIFTIGMAGALALVACNKDSSKTTTTSASSTAAATSTAAANSAALPTLPAATAAPTVAAVTVSPDMNAFMGMLDGKDNSARKALQKYGEKTVASDDLGMYKLHDAKVTKAEKSGDLECYTMQSAAGVMQHTTEVCWDAKGKISKVTDTSK